MALPTLAATTTAVTRRDSLPINSPVGILGAALRYSRGRGAAHFSTSEQSTMKLSKRDRELNLSIAKQFELNVQELTAYALKLTKLDAPILRYMAADTIRKDLNAHYVRVLTAIGESTVSAENLKAEARVH
jgi:hypothetical protein